MALCLFVREPTRASYVKEVRVCLAESWKQTLRFTALPRVSHEAVDLMQRLLCEPVRFRVSVCRRTRTINYNPDFWSPFAMSLGVSLRCRVCHTKQSI